MPEVKDLEAVYPGVAVPDWQLVEELMTLLRPYVNDWRREFRLHVANWHGRYDAYTPDEIKRYGTPRGKPIEVLTLVARSTDQLTGRERRLWIDMHSRRTTVSFLGYDKSVMTDMLRATKQPIEAAADRLAQQQHR